jgi:hypothetical protein
MALALLLAVEIGPGAAEFERGMAAYRAGDCAAAVKPLETAALASSRPSALIALGYCYRQLRQFPQATDAYQRYMHLHADEEKRVALLLDDTLREERAWRREHPEVPAPVRPRFWTWVAGGAGVTALAVSGGFALQARSTGRELSNTSHPAPQTAGLLADYSSQQKRANATAATGLGLLLVSAGLFYWRF